MMLMTLTMLLKVINASSFANASSTAIVPHYGLFAGSNAPCSLNEQYWQTRCPKALGPQQSQQLRILATHVRWPNTFAQYSRAFLWLLG